MAKPTQMTALFLVPSQWTAAKRLAKRKKVSAAAIVREALDQFLERQAALGTAKA
jgi:hypothetical protein